MDITLTNNVNEIYIEYTQAPRYLSIHYKGSFQGEILGDIGNCWVSKNKIIIEFIENPEEILIKYKGAFRILKSFAYDNEKNKHIVKIKTITDEIQRITSKWDTSTQKYEDYNKSNKYSKSYKTLMYYNKAGMRHVTNNKKRFRIINANNNR